MKHRITSIASAIEWFERGTKIIQCRKKNEVAYKPPFGFIQMDVTFGGVAHKYGYWFWIDYVSMLRKYASRITKICLIYED